MIISGNNNTQDPTTLKNLWIIAQNNHVVHHTKASITERLTLTVRLIRRVSPLKSMPTSSECTDPWHVVSPQKVAPEILSHGSYDCSMHAGPDSGSGSSVYVGALASEYVGLHTRMSGWLRAARGVSTRVHSFSCVVDRFLLNSDLRNFVRDPRADDGLEPLFVASFCLSGVLVDPFWLSVPFLSACSGSEWMLSTNARLSELVTDPLGASLSGLRIDPFWVSSCLSTTQITHSCDII